MPKIRFVKAMAVVAIAAGALLLVLEVRSALTTGSWAIWIWGIIALSAIAFGIAELLAKGPDGDPPTSN